MKKHTQSAFRTPATQDRPRKLRLDAETLRALSGGNKNPELMSPPSVGCVKSQSPTLCFE